jgi:iron(III) transport system permease protein
VSAGPDVLEPPSALAPAANLVRPEAPPKLEPVPAAPSRRPWFLIATSSAVALALALPLVFLLLQAQSAGISQVLDLGVRRFTLDLLWNTLRLTVVVTALCALTGTAAAWFVECTDLPLRRMWAVLVVVPLAIPDFVVSFGWVSLSDQVRGFRGAVWVMTLAVYPLVFLPVAASFRNADPRQEEVARSLGVGRLEAFWRITLGQARSAILGGCLLVALVMLAEYGAFEMLGYRTFTTEIFTEFSLAFNVATASALSLVLVIVSFVVLCGEGLVRGRSHAAHPFSRARRTAHPARLGRATPVVLLGFAALVTLALGVPVASAVELTLRSGHAFISGVSLASATWHTAAYGVAAATLATVMALPVALLAVRHHGRTYRLLERSTYLVLAMPGLVIALAFTYFTERYAAGLLYQSATLLVIAYSILFFPLALVGVKASVSQAPPGLEELSRSLGQGPMTTLRRVTLPLVGPGLAAAFCLVFLSAVTELTATLILIPTGVQTLATQFWAYQQNLAYGQAAPFALAMIAIAALPSYVLGRFFHRLPSRRPAQP